VSEGDYRMLEVLASYSSRNAGDSAGMYLSVECADELPFEPAQAVPLRGAFAGMAEAWAGVAASVKQDCGVWNVPASAPHENEPVRSDIPTLVLAGQFDPITPPAYGRQAAETLTRSTFVEFPGYGHAVLDYGCPMDVVLAFLADPSAPVDVSCAGQMTSF
jgi:pimeloyl-ACP methyl ester carboxylesterase